MCTSIVKNPTKTHLILRGTTPSETVLSNCEYSRSTVQLTMPSVFLHSYLLSRRIEGESCTDEREVHSEYTLSVLVAK